MEKFKIVYNIIISIWQICSKYKEKVLNETTCQEMLDELNTRAKDYSGKEWKLMAEITTAIMDYLFRKEQ